MISCSQPTSIACCDRTLLALTGGVIGFIFGALSLIISMVGLYHDLNSMMDAPCGGDGMAYLFAGLALLVAGLGLFVGGVFAMIILAVAGYLIPQMHEALMKSLQGNKILCPQ